MRAIAALPRRLRCLAPVRSFARKPFSSSIKNMADAAAPAAVATEPVAAEDSKEAILDENGQPISKNELKRRQKMAQKEKEKAEKAAKAAEKAAAAPAADKKAKSAAAEEELDPSK